MFEFVVRDDKAVAQAAAGTYFWRMFRAHYFWPYAAGTILFSLMIFWTYRSFGDTWTIGVFALFLFVTVIYAPLFYVARRMAASQMVRKNPERRVRITLTDITIATTDRSITCPWHAFKSIWEYPDFILFEPARNVYWWLPKTGVPDGAVAIIRKAAARAAV